MKKKIYEKLSVSRFPVETEHSVMTGSITLQNVLVQNVTVEEFKEDTEYPSGGFDVDFD